MHFVRQALSVFFLTYAAVAYAAEPATVEPLGTLDYKPAATRVLNFLESPLDLTRQSTADVLLLSLRVKDAERLLASDDGSSWAPYGVVAPKCDEPPQLVGTTKEAKALHAKAVQAFKVNCLPSKKACNEATNFSAKHGVIVTCSALYSEARVLLTTAEHLDYVNPNSSELDLPESDKAPIK